MAARPVASAPLTSPAELEQMIRRAGLSLNAGQLADLALAWRQVSELLGRIPRVWKLADDQAYAFRLPPPTPVSPASTPARKATTRKEPAPTRQPAQAMPARKPAASKAPSAKAPTAKAAPAKPGAKR